MFKLLTALAAVTITATPLAAMAVVTSVKINPIDLNFNDLDLKNHLDFKNKTSVEENEVITKFLLVNKKKLPNVNVSDFDKAEKIKTDLTNKTEKWILYPNKKTNKMRGITDVTVHLINKIDLGDKDHNNHLKLVTDLKLESNPDKNPNIIIDEFIKVNEEILIDVTANDFQTPIKNKNHSENVEQWTLSAKEESPNIKGSIIVNVTLKKMLDLSDSSLGWKTQLTLKESVKPTEKTVIDEFVLQNKDILGDEITSEEFVAKTQQNVDVVNHELWTIGAKEESSKIFGITTISITHGQKDDLSNPELDLIIDLNLGNNAKGIPDEVINKFLEVNQSKLPNVTSKDLIAIKNKEIITNEPWTIKATPDSKYLVGEIKVRVTYGKVVNLEDPTLELKTNLKLGDDITVTPELVVAKFIEINKSKLPNVTSKDLIAIKNKEIITNEPWTIKAKKDSINVIGSIEVQVSYGKLDDLSNLNLTTNLNLGENAKGTESEVIAEFIKVNKDKLPHNVTAKDFVASKPKAIVENEPWTIFAWKNSTNLTGSIEVEVTYGKKDDLSSTELELIVDLKLGEEAVGHSKEVINKFIEVNKDKLPGLNETDIKRAFKDPNQRQITTNEKWIIQASETSNIIKGEINLLVSYGKKDDIGTPELGLITDLELGQNAKGTSDEVIKAFVNANISKFPSLKIDDFDHAWNHDSAKIIVEKQKWTIYSSINSQIINGNVIVTVSYGKKDNIGVLDLNKDLNLGENAIGTSDEVVEKFIEVNQNKLPNNISKQDLRAEKKKQSKALTTNEPWIIFANDHSILLYGFVDIKVTYGKKDDLTNPELELNTNLNLGQNAKGTSDEVIAKFVELNKDKIHGLSAKDIDNAYPSKKALVSDEKWIIYAKEDSRLLSGSIEVQVSYGQKNDISKMNLKTELILGENSNGTSNEVIAKFIQENYQELIGATQYDFEASKKSVNTRFAKYNEPWTIRAKNTSSIVAGELDVFVSYGKTTDMDDLKTNIDLKDALVNEKSVIDEFIKINGLSQEMTKELTAKQVDKPVHAIPNYKKPKQYWYIQSKIGANLINGSALLEIDYLAKLTYYKDHEDKIQSTSQLDFKTIDAKEILQFKIIPPENPDKLTTTIQTVGSKKVPEFLPPELESLAFLFFFNQKNEKIIGIENWDTFNIRDMKATFGHIPNFNQDISKWNVSNVVDMTSIFEGAVSFNQDISKWKLSSVRTIVSMFNKARKFNQNLSTWSIRKDVKTDFYDFDTDSWNKDNRPKFEK